jgi:copper transport protein
MARPINQLLLAICAGLLAAMLSASPAAAHAVLVRSDPADNASLSESPRQIRLWFTETISARFSTAELLDVNGDPVRISSIARDPQDATSLVLDLPELPAGIYSLSWRVHSEVDAHYTRGLIVFGVGAEVSSAAFTAARPTPSIPLFEVILRWINYSVLAGLTGGIAVSLFILPRLPDRPETRLDFGALRRRVRKWIFWCLIALIAGALLALFWQAVAARDSLPAGTPLSSILSQLLIASRWGAAWLARGVLLLFMVFLLWISRDEQPSEGPGAAGGAATMRSTLITSAVLMICAAGLTLLQAATGHAAAVNPGSAASLASDFIHLMTASFWVGGLLALLVGSLPVVLRSRQDRSELLRTVWRPFSWLAAASVLALIATGIYNTGLQVASLDALLTTSYGKALLGKVALMLLVGCAGLVNSLAINPALAAPIAKLFHRAEAWPPLPLRRLPYLMAVEAGLGLFVFLFVGYLTASPPARGPEFNPPAEALPDSLSQQVEDLLVSLSVKPNIPGANVINIRVASTRRPPPAEVLRVITRFTYLDLDLGTVTADAEETEPGMYRLGGNYLSLAGPWEVEVAVRRRGLEDSVARFEWMVASPAARPVMVSAKPLEPVTTAAALGVLALLLGAATIVLIRKGLARS